MQFDESENCFWTHPHESRALGDSPEPQKFSLHDPTLSRWLLCRIVRLQTVCEDFEKVEISKSHPVYQDALSLLGTLQGMKSQFDQKKMEVDLEDMWSEGGASLHEEASLFLKNQDPTQ